MFRNDNLLWSVRTDCRLVGAAGGRRHLVIEVQAPACHETPSAVPSPHRRPPLNLALVIDASGSMTGAPLAAAKEAARGVISRLEARDRVTVVSFAEDVIVHADAVAATEQGRELALEAVARLETRGWTDLAAGWIEGCRRVAAAMDRQPPGALHDGPTQNRVIVLSDGHANQGITDPRELARHAAELRRRGLYTSTVGIGGGYSPVQLDAIAEHGGGRTHDAPSGEDIVAVVLGELGEILETAAEDLAVTVRPPVGMGLEVFGRYPVTRTDGGHRIALGSLVRGASRQVVLQLSAPPGSVGDVHRVDVAPDWRDRDTGIRSHGAVMSALLTVATEAEARAELPDPDVGQVVARMWQNHLRLDSALLNTEGRVDEARSLVHGDMRAFHRFCSGVPGTADLIIELENHEKLVGRPMQASLSLECVDSTKRSLKGDRDYRRFERS